MIKNNFYLKDVKLNSDKSFINTDFYIDSNFKIVYAKICSFLFNVIFTNAESPKYYISISFLFILYPEFKAIK